MIKNFPEAKLVYTYKGKYYTVPIANYVKLNVEEEAGDNHSYLFLEGNFGTVGEREDDWAKYDTLFGNEPRGTMGAVKR